ncbi:hypothetical protein [Sporosarcina sp. UB5]|uniref:hypothetical protein n=1 Tax=Sporosarcina sp. UB5 TaxID=3047463 RepID=UPI003D79ABF0
MITQHMKLIREIDESFEVNKIIFQGEGLIFESDPSSYWLIKKGEDQVYISQEVPVVGFLVRTTKAGVQQEIRIQTSPKRAFDKFRLLDLTYLIAECFDIEKHMPKGNLTEDQQVSFFDLSERYLSYQGLNTEEILKDIHPKHLDTEVAADVLFDSVKSVLLSIREKHGLEEAIKSLLAEYEALSGSDKLCYILGHAKELADRFRIR